MISDNCPDKYGVKFTVKRREGGLVVKQTMLSVTVNCYDLSDSLRIWPRSSDVNQVSFMEAVE